MTSQKDNHGKDSQAKLAVRVEKSIGLLAEAVATLGDFSIELTARDKHRVAKPRPNIATVVPAMATIVTSYGVVLPKHSVEKMTADLETWNTLKPLRDAVAVLLKKIDDAMLVANGDAWSTATAFYTVLRRVSDGGDEIAALLQPFADYFAKSASKKPSKTKKPVNGAAATASPNSSVVTNGASAMLG